LGIVEFYDIILNIIYFKIMAEKKHLAAISILVKDRHNNVAAINKLLTEKGNLIMARLGVNPSRSCVKNCTGLITVIVEGKSREIKTLTKEIDSLYGVVAKVNIMTD
jgi:metal-responsive CopG/Arc/MetJ family transcriptional regulator